MTLFKKFTPKENVASQSQAKSSVQRGIRANLLELYPALEEHMETILPKKCALVLAKCQDHLTLAVLNRDALLFQQRDGPWMPHLRLLHRYPDMMTRVQVDRGAIKFVMSGAQIMAPGLTSAGGRLPDGATKGTAVAVYAEGHEHALAVGVLVMDVDEIRRVNKGVAVDHIHHLNDGLWKTTSV